ncbi:5-methylcytosine-specific restriction endonuclease system specificity protein McrC [Pradoshia eiseniae]|uniref:5-methylcytosine-specific restriction endonuclease system specificity protein McrC n=1 Tax=Pradoshia eiseniae TaxID=2064768 RepID=A0A2S7MX66_9BACI|nr:5-methylcytosine-specific restriction endonuclease system specificity protein McrC [Pradoshia eiseniae]PQD94402.1 5-methylcytosine-specific restriction endonuclease system specificity protein McrC [Pradoshia eiseniae]
MIKDKSIYIQNIYYMLSYAYQCLQQKQYEQIKTEPFDNIQDLFAAILAIGIAGQVKQGLHREYVDKEETLSSLRGKIDMSSSIKLKLQRKAQLACQFDELSENIELNRILKTTSMLLIRSNEVKRENKLKLKKVLIYFGHVDEIEPSFIRWDQLRYHRNNQSYRMLMNICFLVLDGLLLTTEKGDQKLATFLDNQKMSRLFEKFVLEYYRKHYPELRARPSQISWEVDDDIREFLPAMQTDIMLTYGEKTLIIDTKYYGQTMQTIAQFDSHTLRSNNLYQIYTYVKNKDRHHTGNVGGLLLYAKTDEDITLNHDYRMGGNKISVRALDLNRSFGEIATQLDEIVTRWIFEN